MKKNLIQFQNMRYVKAIDVTSPKNHLQSVNVIFDGGLFSFSIAELVFDGDRVYGLRWNVGRNEWDRSDKLNGSTVCLGMPVSRGCPVWFNLPPVSDQYINNFITDEQKRLREEGYIE